MVKRNQYQIVPVKPPFLSPYYPTTPQRRQLSEQGRKDWGNGQIGHMQVYTPAHTLSSSDRLRLQRMSQEQRSPISVQSF